MADQLLDVMATVLRDQAHLDCVCDYKPASWDGSTMVSVKALGYGPGKPRNLVSHDVLRGEIIICLPRRASRNSYADEYGLKVLRFSDDNTANTTGKPFHWAIMSAATFEQLITNGHKAPIAVFLVNAVRTALRERGLSDAGRAKLYATEGKVEPRDTGENEDDYDCTPETAEEGRRQMRAHLAIERNAKLISLKKRATKIETGMSRRLLKLGVVSG